MAAIDGGNPKTSRAVQRLGALEMSFDEPISLLAILQTVNSVTIPCKLK